MLNLTTRTLVSAAALLCASVAMAQDKALLDILIKKGIVTSDEATQLTKELAKANAATDVTTSGAKNLAKLTISGRFQAQFVTLNTDIDNTAADPVATQHFLLRRIYLGAKADFGNGFLGNVVYDFANASFDTALIEWKQSDQLVLDVGFRKAPIGLEEWDTSSGNLKAIERSPATRYFVESNNGRRLGAGSYRTGVFVGGSENGFFYNVAVTNPERDEFSSLNGNSDPGVQGSGTAANNNLAYWINGGYKGKLPDGSYRVGVSGGWLPDQGGLVLGKGDDLTVGSAYGVLTVGKFDLEGEYWWGHDDHGVSATRDARPTGYWVQPSFMVTPTVEAVVRYSSVDSDGRGVNLSDGTRSAPGGGTMNKMSEWYLGGTWFLRGPEVKLQLGYILAESKDTVTGAPAKATTEGVRSQMQVNF